MEGCSIYHRSTDGDVMQTSPGSNHRCSELIIDIARKDNREKKNVLKSLAERGVMVIGTVGMITRR